MKKILAIAMAMTMGLSLVACGGNDAADSTAEAPAADGAETDADAAEPDDTEAAADGAGAASEGEAQYTVGICQLVQHEALDAATKGFIDALNEELGEGTVAFH